MPTVRYKFFGGKIHDNVVDYKPENLDDVIFRELVFNQSALYKLCFFVFLSQNIHIYVVNTDNTKMSVIKLILR